ncbi:MAG: hypothetical protein PHX14_13265 [Syntrophomonadaceae bacterium]|nr:hypothetical protein [Syntrophomonadaceae bacterium]
MNQLIEPGSFERHEIVMYELIQAGEHTYYIYSPATSMCWWAARFVPVCPICTTKAD